MIVKTACLILGLSLTLGIVPKHCNSTVVKGKNGYNLSKPKGDLPEIFEVSRDTIHVSIEGTLSRALLIHDKYYAFYEVRDPSSDLSIKKFYIIGKTGKIEKEIKVPEGIHNEYYYHMYYWNGRIIVNTEFYKNTYYLDEDKGEFVKDPESTTVPLFEDGNYLVTSDCRGEWGSVIYFKNKLTGIMYSAISTCPFLLNKLGDKYFVNTSDMLAGNIIEIKVPVKLKEASNSIITGTVYRLTDSTIFRNNGLDRNFSIPSSFVTNGSLYHIYNSHHNSFDFDDRKERIIVANDTVKIGVINNGEFQPIYTFKDKFDVELEQQLSPDYQICTFHTEGRIEIGFKKDIPPYMEAKYGFIEIKGNKIKIHYFISKKTV